jgi:hypothetical protein
LDNPEYLTELAALPLIPEQGDGMRSFVGLLLVLAATPFPIVLIDEPEAFLHPPQARELGRQLAERGEQQRFIATHNIDVLLGLLDTAQSLTVIRLQWTGVPGDGNRAAVLNHERINGLWQDPWLRYAGVLDGLFHRGTVACEAEGDAQLYAAALDVARRKGNEPSSDLMFTHSGGKHRLPAVVEALRALDVPAAAIVDLDILRDAALLKKLVEGLGGDWSSFEQDQRELAAAVNALPVHAPTIGDVLEQLGDILGAEHATRLTEYQTRRIREVTKSSDGWRAVRGSGGISAFPRGQASETAARLVSHLAEIGLFVVPVGELEGWDRTIGGHGSEFVRTALDRKLHQSSEQLQAFVVAVATSLDRGVAG